MNGSDVIRELLRGLFFDVFYPGNHIAIIGIPCHDFIVQMQGFVVFFYGFLKGGYFIFENIGLYGVAFREI